MEAEIWKDIQGYERYYRVSNFGNILSVRSGKLLKPSINNCGYLILSLTVGGRKSFLVHRLVGIHFVPNPKGLKELNHKDGDKLNCCAWNIEWTTRKENIRHAINVLGFDHHTINKDKVGALNWNSKEVNQFNLDGSFVAKYGSTTEAFRETGIDFSSIQKVCLGKRGSAGGFKWTYTCG